MRLKVAPPPSVVSHAEAFYERHRVQMIYEGSDGEATQALYAELAGYGPTGLVALNLFRAQKCAARAALFPTGPHYAVLAAGRKKWALEQLVARLVQTDGLGFTWGWGDDPTSERYPWVLYVELPTGQVRFPAIARGEGPDYPGGWDGVVDASAERILAWVDGVLHPGIVGPAALVLAAAAVHAQAPLVAARRRRATTRRKHWR
jgi:hypothetical protein